MESTLQRHEEYRCGSHTGKQRQIIEDVNADVINKGNHNGVFVKDNNVQAQKSHYYLPDRQEQAVW